MEKDFNGFPPFSDFASSQGFDYNEFNPMVQYEQAYIYYRYLCMQMDYRIKCKEYEKMCNEKKSN